MPRRWRCMAFASLLTGAGALGALHCGSFDSESSKAADDGGGDAFVAVDGTNDAPAIDTGCADCEPITYTTFPGGEATVLSYAAGGLYWLDKVKNKVGACEDPAVPCKPRD